MLYLKNPECTSLPRRLPPLASLPISNGYVSADDSNSNPSRTPWGKNAFSNYINPSSRSLPPVEWLAYDSSHLLSRSEAPKGDLHVLVDVGTEDKFLKDGQLEPDALTQAAKEAERQDGEVQVRMQDGFDHSYYFVSEIRCSQVGYTDHWADLDVRT